MNVRVVIVAAMVSFRSATGRGRACNFENSCNIYGQDCSTGEDCIGMTHKPLDAGRGFVTFNVNISSEFLEYYRQNVTFSVAYEVNDTWGTVGDCCNMKPNVSTCELRPKRDLETFFLIAQLASGRLCSSVIQERQQIPWCDVDNTTTCMEIKEDSIWIRKNIDFVSFDFLTEPAEYFLFRADRDYASSGKVIANTPFTRDIDGMELNLENRKVNVRGVQTEIEVVKKESTAKLSEIISGLEDTCEMWCFFHKVKNHAPATKPICHVPWVQAGYPDKCATLEAWHVAILCAIVIVLLVSILIVIRCVRSRVKYCHPDPEEAQKYIPTHTKEILVGNDVGENHLSAKENPDSIAVCVGPKGRDQHQTKDLNSNHEITQGKDIFEGYNTENPANVQSTNRVDFGLGENMHNPPCPETGDEIIDEYCAKVAVASVDSGFGTIGSGLSNTRSVGSSITQDVRGGESPDGSKETGTSPLNICLSYITMDEIRRHDENTMTEQPLATEEVPLLLKGSSLHDALNADDYSDAFSGIYQSKSPGFSIQNFANLTPRQVHRTGDNNNLKDNFTNGVAHQRDPSFGCDTGRKRSSYDGDDNSEKFLFGDLVLQLDCSPGYVHKTFTSSNAPREGNSNDLEPTCATMGYSRK